MGPCGSWTCRGCSAWTAGARSRPASSPGSRRTGRKLAVTLVDDHDDDIADRLVGWAVYDTVTGKVRRYDDPDRPDQAPSLLDLAFSGDSKYLLTSYTPTGEVTNRSDAFVAFDLKSGERTVLEEPGRYWLPSVGLGPTGAVWSQNRTTYLVDPASGERSTVVTPRDVVMSSVAPDGVGFAYFGGDLDKEGISVPWTLYVGRSPSALRPVPGLDSGGILGWRDATHVVVGVDGKKYAVVDITDGSFTHGRIAGDVNLNVPMIAADLWAYPLVDGVRPPAASDPRPYKSWWFAGGAAVALGTLLLVRRRRRG